MCLFIFIFYSMWVLISGEWSHVSEVCVALLLHFIALPDGADIFWKLCENHFNHSDWKVRFEAGITVQQHCSSYNIILFSYLSFVFY